MTEHVTYLGSFVVSDMLYRGDLFRDGDRYVAKHVLTNPDGTWFDALHAIDAGDESTAISYALRSILEYLHRDGKLGVITVIHFAPGIEGMAEQVLKQPAASPYLQ